MLRQARLVLASLIAVAAAATFAGCVGGERPSEGDEEDVASVEQPLPSSGYFRTYYTDSTYSEAVGWENYDCDPNYRFMEGEETRHWKQHRYDCPEFNNPLLPACELCNTYTTNDGYTFTSCTASTCPIVW